MEIIIEAYNPNWALAYQQLREVYEHHLNGLYCDIQHVGSTSVEGLAAKPILDIDIIIDDEKLMPKITEVLEGIGYSYNGTMGIPGRHAFSAGHANIPFSGKIHWMSHHLYVCPQDSLALQNHLGLRNYLRNHPEAVAAYSALKYRLAKEAPTMDWYVEQKTDFIAAILQKCGFADNMLDEIRKVNRCED